MLILEPSLELKTVRLRHIETCGMLRGDMEAQYRRAQMVPPEKSIYHVLCMSVRMWVIAGVVPWAILDFAWVGSYLLRNGLVWFELPGGYIPYLEEPLAGCEGGRCLVMRLCTSGRHLVHDDTRACWSLGESTPRSCSTNVDISLPVP
jgi:hypothetical protein